MVTLSITADQAKLLIAALQQYQGGNEAILNGWRVSESPTDLQAYTTVLAVWGEVEVLKNTLFETIA